MPILVPVQRLKLPVVWQELCYILAEVQIAAIVTHRVNFGPKRIFVRDLRHVLPRMTHYVGGAASTRQAAHDSRWLDQHLLVIHVWEPLEPYLGFVRSEPQRGLLVQSRKRYHCTFLRREERRQLM